MSVFVRKIDKSKWFQTDIMHGADISADAITNCMKTKGNTLSVWKAESEDNLDEVVLAIIAGHQHLETIDVVPLTPEYLRESGIDCIPSCGRTPVENLAEAHVDLAHLSYRKLGIVAYHIADKIREERVKRYTRSHQKEILREAINAGRLIINDLSDSVRRKVYT